MMQLAAPLLRVHLLGPLEAWAPGVTLTLPRSRKPLAVLALLALCAPAPVPRGRIAGLLWSESAQARNSLRQAVHELSAAFSDLPQGTLLADRDSLALRHVWVDTAAVANHVPSRDDCGVLQLLARGRLLPDLDGLDPMWDAHLAAERARHAARIEAVIGQRLAEAETCVELARRLVDIDSGHEPAWQALIRACLADGQRAQALRAYRDCEVALKRELDVEPSLVTQALAKSARSQLVPEPAGVAAVRSAPGRTGARLAVLPPRPIGPGIEAFLPDALVEVLAGSLAGCRWLTVLSPAVALPLAARLHAGSASREELGLDYLLDGTLMRRSAGRIWLTLRLADVNAGGEIVWSRRIEAAGETAEQQLVEEVTEVVAAIDPVILMIEHRRAAVRSADTGSGHACLLRAIPLLFRMEPGGYRDAGALLRRAMAQDPENAPAHAWAAFWTIFDLGQGWVPAHLQTMRMREAAVWAERAVALDPEDAMALTTAGHMRAFLDRQPLDGLRLHRRALALNPSLACAWAFAAAAHCYLGQADEAFRCIERHHRLAPAGMQADFFRGISALACAVSGRWVEAADAAAMMLRAFPHFLNSRKILAGALGQLGRSAEAQEAIAPVFRQEPNFSVAHFEAQYPLLDDAARMAIANGLRRGGVRERSGRGHCHAE